MNNRGKGAGGTPYSQIKYRKTKTLTCKICTEPILSENQINPSKCNHHPFCSTCVIKYIRSKLNDKVAKIRCPALNCDRFLDPLVYRALVGPQTFIRWCDVLCESALMNFKKSYCPNKNCLALIVDECGGTGRKPLTKTNCPNCKQLFCFKCMKPWHAGFSSCNEAGRFMNDPNDGAFLLLAEKRQWQRCPGCRTYVERVSGCSTISCRCGVPFCYQCGANRFRGIGDNCECKCNFQRGIEGCEIVLYIVGILILPFLMGYFIFGVFNYFGVWQE